MRRIRHNSGFTLAEVLLAASVLAIAIAAISQTVSTGQDQSFHALHEMRAIGLASGTVMSTVEPAFSRIAR